MGQESSHTHDFTFFVKKIQQITPWERLKFIICDWIIMITIWIS